MAGSFTVKRQSWEKEDRLLDFLVSEGFYCQTLNAFPQGEFHADRVKEEVYVPDWRQKERLSYTLDSARVLAELLPAGEDSGTLSTLPLGFRSSIVGEESLCISNLKKAIQELAILEEESGQWIQLCLEPEPCCAIETIQEFITFYEALLLESAELRSGGLVGEELVRRFLGLCYDSCHQAVEFGEPSYEFELLARKGIPVGKIQLSSALELVRPGDNPDGLNRLSQFAEPRFLHQVVAQRRDQSLERFVDLPRFLESQAANPAEFEIARCHFHVPIHFADAWPLRTTQPQLCEVLNWLHHQDHRPQLEIETYTFDVLPEGFSTPLVDCLEREINFAMAGLEGGFDDAA